MPTNMSTHFSVTTVFGNCIVLESSAFITNIGRSLGVNTYRKY